MDLPYPTYEKAIGLYLIYKKELDHGNKTSKRVFRQRIESKLSGNGVHTVNAICSITYTLTKYMEGGDSEIYHVYKIVDDGWGMYFSYEEYDDIVSKCESLGRVQLYRASDPVHETLSSIFANEVTTRALQELEIVFSNYVEYNTKCNRVTGSRAASLKKMAERKPKMDELYLNDHFDRIISYFRAEVATDYVDVYSVRPKSHEDPGYIDDILVSQESAMKRIVMNTKIPFDLRSGYRNNFSGLRDIKLAIIESFEKVCKPINESDQNVFAAVSVLDSTMDKIVINIVDRIQNYIAYCATGDKFMWSENVKGKIAVKSIEKSVLERYFKTMRAPDVKVPERDDDLNILRDTNGNMKIDKTYERTWYELVFGQYCNVRSWLRVVSNTYYEPYVLGLEEDDQADMINLYPPVNFIPPILDHFNTSICEKLLSNPESRLSFEEYQWIKETFSTMGYDDPELDEYEFTRLIRLAMNHIRKYICSDNKDLYIWFCNYMTTKLYEPSKRIEKYMMIVGPQGCGKTSVVNAIRTIYGECFVSRTDYFKSVHKNEFVESHMAEFILGVHDDFSYVKGTYARMKQLATTYDLTIRDLHTKSRSGVPYWGDIIFTSNGFHMPMPADDRRFVILAAESPSFSKIEKDKYFDDLYVKVYGSEFMCAVMTWVMCCSRKEGFDFRKDPEITVMFKKQMKQMGQISPEEEILNIFVGLLSNNINSIVKTDDPINCEYLHDGEWLENIEQTSRTGFSTATTLYGRYKDPARTESIEAETNLRENTQTRDKAWCTTTCMTEDMLDTIMKVHVSKNVNFYFNRFISTCKKIFGERFSANKAFLRYQIGSMTQMRPGYVLIWPDYITAYILLSVHLQDKITLPNIDTLNIGGVTAEILNTWLKCYSTVSTIINNDKVQVTCGFMELVKMTFGINTYGVESTYDDEYIREIETVLTCLNEQYCAEDRQISYSYEDNIFENTRKRQRDEESESDDDIGALPHLNFTGIFTESYIEALDKQTTAIATAGFDGRRLTVKKRRVDETDLVEMGTIESMFPFVLYMERSSIEYFQLFDILYDYKDYKISAYNGLNQALTEIKDYIEFSVKVAKVENQFVSFSSDVIFEARKEDACICKEELIAYIRKDLLFSPGDYTNEDTKWIRYYDDYGLNVDFYKKIMCKLDPRQAFGKIEYMYRIKSNDDIVYPQRNIYDIGTFFEETSTRLSQAKNHGTQVIDINWTIPVIDIDFEPGYACWDSEYDQFGYMIKYVQKRLEVFHERFLSEHPTPLVFAFTSSYTCKGFHIYTDSFSHAVAIDRYDTMKKILTKRVDYEEYLEHIVFYDDRWMDMCAVLPGHELLRLLTFSDEERIKILKKAPVYPVVHDAHIGLLDTVLSLYKGNRAHMCRILHHLFTVPIDEGPLSFNHMCRMPYSLSTKCSDTMILSNAVIDNSPRVMTIFHEDKIKENIKWLKDFLGI